MFKLLQQIVNGTFFPLCIVLFGIFIWPVVHGLRQKTLAPADLGRLRRRCLRMGPGTVLTCLWAWVAAGVIFPVVMHLTVHELPAAFHLHFLVSQTICGLIAVSYPQFGTTFLALRGIYPAFVPTATLSADDSFRCGKWSSRSGGICCWPRRFRCSRSDCWRASAPRIGSRRACPAPVSLAGFAGAYLLVTAIRADAAALEDLVRNKKAAWGLAFAIKREPPPKPDGFDGGCWNSQSVGDSRDVVI